MVDALWLELYHTLSHGVNWSVFPILALHLYYSTNATTSSTADTITLFDYYLIVWTTVQLFNKQFLSDMTRLDKM